MYLKSIAGIAAAITAILTLAFTIWSYQPFALAGELEEYRTDQLDTAIELYQMQESDLILKGGTIERRLEVDPGNSFLSEQKQIIDKELSRTRGKRQYYQRERIAR